MTDVINTTTTRILLLIVSVLFNQPATMLISGHMPYKPTVSVLFSRVNSVRIRVSFRVTARLYGQS